MQSFNGGTSSASFSKRCVFRGNPGFYTTSQPWFHIILAEIWMEVIYFILFLAAMTSVKTLDYHNLIHPQLIYTLWTCCAPKLWLKNKWQTASKLPWATRGDLDDWITLNYPKPLCRCESRCEKMNYYFQLIHTTESLWRAKPADHTCTEHSKHLIWWRQHIFPTRMS